MDIKQSTLKWLNDVVIELNLCPFAKAEVKHNKVRLEVCTAQSPASLLQHLQSELCYLNQHTHIETTLLIHPNSLNDFSEFNEFLNLCDELLMDMQLEGIYQIASFHPDYQFAETQYEDAENYSNRSPYPMLHILREASLEKAINNYPDSHKIPQNNIKKLNLLGAEHCKKRLYDCFID